MKNDVAAVQRRWWERLRNTRRERIEFVQASADFFLRLGVDLPRIEHPNDRCQFAENVGDKPNSQAKELFFGRGARHRPELSALRRRPANHYVWSPAAFAPGEAAPLRPRAQSSRGSNNSTFLTPPGKRPWSRSYSCASRSSG